MTDTLTNIIDAIQKNQNIGIDLIQKVDSFYNNAWTKLLVVLGIIGVLVPLFINWLQKEY